MKKIAVSFLLLLFLAFDACATAQLLWTFNAEDGTVGQKPPRPPLTAVTGPNIPLIASSPVFSGTKSYDVFLDRSQPTILGAVQNPYRTEFRGDTNIQFQFERSYWIGLAFRRTIWDSDTSSENFPIQIHETPGNTVTGDADWTNWGVGTCQQSAASSAPIVMISANNVMQVKNLTTSIWSKPIDLNTWHTVVFHVKWSKANTGYVESWYDGVAQPRKPASGTTQTHRADSVLNAYCGPNTTITGDVGFVQPIFAGGIYKWDWKLGRPATLTTVRRGFIDAIKIAQDIDGNDDAGGYALVNPGPVGGGGDTTPPVISNVQVGSITNNSATVIWTTNELSDSTVNYGKTSALGSTAFGPGNVSTHSTVVSGLDAGTLYYAKVTSKDASNNSATSSTAITFTTTAVDITPPVVSNISSPVTDNSATINWTTNEPATSRVKIWWPENTDGVAQFFPELVTSHRITFSDLSPAKLYNAKITSVDEFNNVNDLNSFTFTTNELVARPVISNILINIASTQATINFETQVDANGFIDYGPTRSYGSTLGTESLSQTHTIILPNLVPNKVYHWRIRTANKNGLAAESIRMSFFTLNPSGMTSDGFK